MAIKTDTIGINYGQIPDNLTQTFFAPSFSFRSVSSADVAKRRFERKIGDDVVEIIRFIFQSGFVTLDQINRGTRFNVDESFMDNLASQHFVNYFVLNETMEEKLIQSPGDLRIYVLDFAGSYLLMSEGEDITKWRHTDSFRSSKVIRKVLKQTELFIAFKNLKKLSIRDYQKKPEFRLNGEPYDVDFSVSLGAENSFIPINFIGVVAEKGTEDLFFSDTLRGINAVFKETNAGYKYYPLDSSTLPRLLVVIEDSTDKQSIVRAANAIGRCTDYSGSDLMIIGYNEMVAVGLADAHYFSIRITEDPTSGTRKVEVGSVTNATLK